MLSRFVALLFLFQATVQAFFSINYAADSSHPMLMTAPGVFKEAPQAEHVADIYARLSGNPPIFWEGKENMPAIDILIDNAPKPILLEINGGILPTSVQPVIKSVAFEGNSRGPSVQSVVDVLQTRGITVDAQKMEGNENLAEDLQQWLAAQARPVIILHHETPAAYHYIERTLAASTVTPLTEFQISQYQICLWTGVGMILLVGAAISCVVSMEVIPDSLLFAKFQSARTHKND